MEDTERGGGGGWGGHTNHHHKNPVSSFPPLFSSLYISMSIVLLGTTSDSADASA